MTNATTTPTRCTISMASHPDGKCGRPAVTTFTGRDGTVYAECAVHDASGAMTRAISTSAGVPAPGDRVTVHHAGMSKDGTVVRVTATRALVRVATPYGRRDALEVWYRHDEVTAR